MAFPFLNTFLLACLTFGFIAQAQSTAPFLPQGRLAASPAPGSNFLPVVVYQSNISPGYALIELHATTNGWRYGGMTQPDTIYLPQIGTPMTSLLYPSTGEIYLYYVSTNNMLVERVRSNTGSWGAGRYMNPSVYSGSRGMTSYLDPTGQITIWYQDSENTIKRCLWRSTGCLAEAGGGPSIGNVLPGSDMASFQDDVGHQHIYYQSTDAKNPIMEMAWSNNQWNFGTLVENAPQQVSFESILSTTAQFWQLNRQIFNQVTLATYDANGCAGWCYAQSLVQTRDYTAALSVTSSGGAIRAYFVTSAGKLGELGNGGGGTPWGVVPDLLAIAT